MIRLLDMVVENFLSFGKVEFSFRGQGLTHVEGENQDDRSAKSNGSGKSALIDALLWCLFGKTLRGYENDEVVHRKIGEDCLVMVYFESGGTTYSVARARRHSKYKNQLRVMNQDDVDDMTLASNAETQVLVEKLLGCSLRTFMSSVVFGQDRAYRFSALTDKEQKEVLDEVLGVERFADAGQVARQLASSIDGAVDKLTADLARANELRDATQEELDTIHAKNAKFEADKAQRVYDESAKVTKLREQLKKTDKVDVDKLKAFVEKAERDVANYEKVVVARNEKLTEAKVALAGMKSRAEELQQSSRDHQKLKGDCPTCGQEVDAKVQRSVVSDINKKLVVLVKQMEEARDTVDETTRQHTAASDVVKMARVALTKAQRDVTDAASAEGEVTTLRRRLKDHETRVAEIQAEENPYEALVERLDARVTKYGKESELLTVQLAEEEARLKTSRFWVDAFGARGLRSLLLDTSLPVLNAEAARVSRAVTGNAIKVEFSATSDLKSGKTIDRFEVRVDNKHGAGSYLGNSSGERAKVDLCVGLAIQQLVASRSSATFNVVFLDEVFDHLDAAAHERVVEVLSDIDKESVFVVSHNEDLKAWFPHSISVVKRGGFSEIHQ